MKKLLLAFLLLFAMTANAEHLKFMGIPIDGPISTFQTKLTTKGFKFLKREDDAQLYKGKFFGESVTLYVPYDTKNKSVYEVRVLFPDMALVPERAFYDEVFKSLSDKYVFDAEKKQNKSYYETTELRSSVFFAIEDDKFIGIITLSEGSKYNDYWTVLEYSDAENLQKCLDSVKNDL